MAPPAFSFFPAHLQKTQRPTSTVQPNAALPLQKGQKILPGGRTALQVRPAGKYLVSRAAEYRHATEICVPPRVSPIGDALNELAAFDCY